MSDDDFGTVNVRRGERAREIELLRKHYRDHRDALGRLAAEAPTEYLAGEYHRLIATIDNALGKIDDLEGHPPQVDPHGDPLRAKTEPGTRTLITPTPAAPPPPPAGHAAEPEHIVPPAAGSRLLLMIVAAVVVLAIIGYLIYRASGDRRASTTTTTTIAESTAPAVTETAPGTVEPVTPAPATAARAAGALTLTPAVADYGTIRKGTRAARQIEVTNGSTAPISIKVARSECKCLFYEYKDTIAPKKKETITVTVDGARAKSGTLAETIDVTSKSDPSVTTAFQVSATIK